MIDATLPAFHILGVVAHPAKNLRWGLHRGGIFRILTPGVRSPYWTKGLWIFQS